MAFTPALKDKLADHGLEQRLAEARLASKEVKAQAAAKEKLSVEAGAKNLAPIWRALNKQEHEQKEKARLTIRYGKSPDQTPTRLSPPSSPILASTVDLPLQDIYSAIRLADGTHQSELWNSILLLRERKDISDLEKKTEEAKIVVQYNNTYPWPMLADERDKVQAIVEQFNERGQEILAREKENRTREQERLKMESDAREEERRQEEIQAKAKMEALELEDKAFESQSSSPSPTSSSSSSPRPSTPSELIQVKHTITPTATRTISNSNNPSTDVPKDGSVYVANPIQAPANPDPILGQILVNNVPLHRYFRVPRDRETVMRPFRIAGLVGAFNVFALVKDGGSTGQSGALGLAIARGLVHHNPLLKAPLEAGQ